MPDLSVVVPVYNEENNISIFLDRLIPVLKKINLTYEIIFCLDPSEDRSEEIIYKNIIDNPNIKLIIMSRRFGQPAATICGILECSGIYCVVIDADLQDPPELINDLYEKIIQGYEIIYARRKFRKGETLLKKIISHFGYLIINKLSDVQIPRNTGDFRIMTRRAVEHLRLLNESHGFLRGMASFIGFKQDFVEYVRDERYSGSGKYNRYIGSLKIGMNGLISFSAKPLFIMSILGFFFAIISFALGGWYLIQKVTGVNITPGLSTTVIVVTFFSGIQLLGLGLIGEYIGRIYDEVKRRPLYIIDKKINFK